MQPAPVTRRRSFQLAPDTLNALEGFIDTVHHQSGGTLRKWRILDAVIRTGLDDRDAIQRRLDTDRT